MRDIAYATDHNFILVTAVSLLSLCEKNERNFVFHILIDESVTDDDLKILKEAAESNGGNKICFHIVSNELLDNVDFSYTYLNKSTLYRLFLPQILPEIDVCLFIDADTLVCGSIEPLLDTELSENLIAGVWDSGIEDIHYHLDELPNMDSYINAGVLLLNLRLMREENMIAEFIKKIPNHYWYNDQDILNICCKGRIKLLPEKYNYFSHRAIGVMKPVIIHMLSWAGTRPWINTRSNLADIWWGYARRFADTDIYLNLAKAADEWYEAGSLRHLLELASKYRKVYIWGNTALGIKVRNGLTYNGTTNISGVIDNNPEYIGRNIIGSVIMQSSELEYSDDTLIIVTAQKSREPIKDELMSLGYKEEQIFCYQKRPVGFYTVLDDKYRDEELNEVLLWEYGNRLL